MKVRDVMVTDVKTCIPETNLAQVCEVFWSQGCGTVPVVRDGRVVGMLTDRDVAIALGTRNNRAVDTLVSDVALPKLFSCQPDDDIHDAMRIMQRHRIRRLPVIDNAGALRGILSVDDAVLHAQPRGDLTYEDIVETMQAICEHAVPHAE